jgi:HlyD family secretion protein
MKKNVKIIIGLLLIIILGSGFYWLHSSDGTLAQQDTLVLYGNVDIREVRLAFNGSEHVGKILVDEGDKVKKGQLLAQLHTDRLATSRERASAQLAAAQAEEKAAKLSYQRVKSLAARKLASPDVADVAEAKSLAAQANVDVARAGLADIDQRLKDARLYAPEDGIIRDRIVEEGDFVTPQTPVLTLALLDPVWIRAYLPETYLGQVKPGAAVSVTTDSYPGKHYKGWVGSISPTAEFTPKTVESPELRTRLVYQLRVFVCNPENEMRLGMPATVTVALNAGDQQINISSQHCTPQETATTKN